MASISGYSPSAVVQQGFQQVKLQEARRNAAQAEATAQALQSEAATARQRATQAEENARDLSVRASQAEQNAGAARQGLEAIRSLSQLSGDLMTTYERLAKSTQTSATVATTPTVSSTQDTAASRLATALTPAVSGTTIDTTA